MIFKGHNKIGFCVLPGSVESRKPGCDFDVARLQDLGLAQPWKKGEMGAFSHSAISSRLFCGGEDTSQQGPFCLKFLLAKVMCHHVSSI